MEKCPFADSGLPNPHTSASTDAAPEPSVTRDEAVTESENEPSNASNDHGDAKPVDNSSPVAQGRCPWPFIFFHDPKTGMTDWQTWVVLGLVLCFAWNKIQKFL